MDDINHILRTAFRSMLTAPWQQKGSYKLPAHWFGWMVGWLWSLTGLVAGAFFAPAVLRRVGLSNSPYQDIVAIGITLVTDFLVQLVWWVLFVLIVLRPGQEMTGRPVYDRFFSPTFFLLSLATAVLMFIVVGYGLYRHYAAIGYDKRLVTTAAVGGFLIKAILIVLIWIKRALGIGLTAQP